MEYKKIFLYDTYFRVYTTCKFIVIESIALIYTRSYRPILLNLDPIPEDQFFLKINVFLK